MFKPLFAAMNEVLDAIIESYPNATGSVKQELEEQLNVLKQMSDTCIEEWLAFEEKMGALAKPKADWEEPAKPKGGTIGGVSDAYQKGQGFFHLLMFEKAVTEFEKAVKLDPESLMARLYLGLSYLQTDQHGEAYRHFQFIIPLTEDHKLKAVAYNAMGCIHVKRKNMEQAMEYFELAHETDPHLKDPVKNMEICMTNPQLTAQFGSNELH